jgi:(p)ppGpp synthase/HD superfamily hydrolase
MQPRASVGASVTRMTDAERGLLERAFGFALAAHGDQRRKGSEIPYASHVLGVAALVLEHGGGAEQAAAAFLHDTLEDCEGVTAARLRAEFGERIARIVEICTDTGKLDRPGAKGPWRERKERYLAQLAEGDADAALVAACDKRHNLGTIVADVRHHGVRYLERFNAGPADQLWYYESVTRVLRPLIPLKLALELELLVTDLQELIAPSVVG